MKYYQFANNTCAHLLLQHCKWIISLSLKKTTFISSFLVIMKGLEAKILSEWILNPWIFLNNTQDTFSIWTSIMNSELFWMGIASIVHTWPKNQWFPSLPFTSPEGSMSWPLSVNVKPVIRKQLLWFSRTLLCCGNDMIWICLLTNTISVACNYYNVEPQRVYKHCHEILHLTSPSGACDFMLIFTLLN